MSAVEVAILECASCGASIPFGDGETLSCAYCGAASEVPEEHRALRAAEREYNQHRDEAHRLLRRLGKPPSWLVRFLTDAHGGTVIWLVVLGTIVSALLCEPAFDLVARLSLALFHADIDDVVLYRFDPNALYAIVQLAFLLAGLGSLVVLGAYARQRGAGLRELQAGLSARPPTRIGGPATCRQCGAPLSTKPEDTAVTCDYCRADNLLKIPESWIGATRDRVRRLAGSVEYAAQAFREEEREIRRSMVVRLVIVGVISSTFLGFLVGATQGARIEWETVSPYRRSGGDFYFFDWNASVTSPSFTLDRGDSKGCRGVDCYLSLSEVPCAERYGARALVVPEGACDEEVCTLHYYVALRRGDAIELTGSELPPRSFILLKSHVREAPFHGDAAAWGTQVPGAFAWLTDGNPARLPAAPHDGWFQLIIGLGQAMPGMPLPLCARLERDGR